MPRTASGPIHSLDIKFFAHRASANTVAKARHRLLLLAGEKNQPRVASRMICCGMLRADRCLRLLAWINASERASELRMEILHIQRPIKSLDLEVVRLMDRRYN